MLARLCRQLRPAFLDSRCSFSTSAACNDPGGVLARVVREHIDYVKLSGLYKEELSFTGPQSAVVHFEEDEKDIINLCSSNYLGLANHPKLKKAAADALQTHGLGLSSMRYICGTTDLHRTLEAKISAFHGTEDTMLYSSCTEANMGLFQALLTEEDAVISDTHNHGSSIDGMRLSKARRHRYIHVDMQDLEETLKETADARIRLIVTDGVFSMSGHMAPLKQICDLAEKYDSSVLVCDGQATGVVGSSGQGSVEACGVQGRVDILNSTLGKALSGGNGGYTTGSAELIQCLRQRSRPYIFSNSLAPPLVNACIAAFDMISSTSEPRDRLLSNAKRFREQMVQAGFDLKEGVPHIVPIMLGDSTLANDMAHKMLKRGIYVVSHTYPVVKRGEAGIRVQISAAHTHAQLDQAVQAFTEVGHEFGVIE